MMLKRGKFVVYCMYISSKVVKLEVRSPIRTVFELLTSLFLHMLLTVKLNLHLFLSLLIYQFQVRHRETWPQLY